MSDWSIRVNVTGATYEIAFKQPGREPLALTIPSTLAVAITGAQLKHDAKMMKQLKTVAKLVTSSSKHASLIKQLVAAATTTEDIAVLCNAATAAAAEDRRAVVKAKRR